MFTNNKTPKFYKTVPSTPLQLLAQKENFALFQLKSMQANLHHLKLCATIPQSSILSLQNTMAAIEKKIKLEQANRKKARKVKDNGQT